MEYGLIGEHLGHSFSKTIHEDIAHYSYELKELKKEELPEFLKERAFKAINVTIPYKQEVIPLLDEIAPSAKKVGAVNTIINRNGKLIGYNTDYDGLIYLVKKSGIQIKDKKVLILGAGGASLACEACAKSLGARSITKSDFKARPGVLAYNQLSFDYQIIFNATPCGMYPNNIDDILIDIKKYKHLEGIIDCVYNPLSTRLVLEAKELKIPAMGGLGMLIAQAVFAIQIFLDKTLDKKIIDKYYNKLTKEKENIVLIGMPSSGKTTVGKLLSEKLNKKLVDIDEVIEKDNDIVISEYIPENGILSFRQLEKEAVKEISKENNQIISTGGGVIFYPENIRHLHANGRIFFIDRPLELLTPTSDRPLSSDYEALKKLYNERYDKYLSYCDYHIINNSSIDDVVNKILEVIKNEDTCY